MNKNDKIKILVVASEVAPFAKTGGLGDVVGSLPKELRKHNIDVRVVLPKYKSIKESFFNDIEYLGDFNVALGWRNQKAGVLKKETEVTTYFIENDYYFGEDSYYGYENDNERFSFFCKAVLNMLQFIDFYPDIVHCNDWQTGPIPMLLNRVYKKFTAYKDIKTLYTIHNLQYQGSFNRETIELLDLHDECFDECEFYGQLNFMKAGILYCDKISTVSKTYAEEIKTLAYGYGLDGVLKENERKLIGILNGIDFDVNNPKTDSRLVVNYDISSVDKKRENKLALQKQLGLEERDILMISIISRLADQKGFDIILPIAEDILGSEVQLVILGTGEKKYEDFFRELQWKYSGRVSSNITFDDTLAQRIYASSDIFLMPSIFEPCGLGQMFSLRYGTIPVVRKTGGLKDTVKHFDEKNGEGNGFVFEHISSEGLSWALNEALGLYNNKQLWRKIVINAMDSDNSWDSSGNLYVELYKEILS